MGQRNASGSQRSNRGGDARNRDHLDTVAAQEIRLFAAATEDERVAAFEAQDTPPGACLTQHERVELVLRQAVPALRLADIEAVGVAADTVEDLGPDQLVVEHHVRLLHQLHGPDGQQVGITRPGAHEIDHPGLRPRGVVQEAHHLRLRSGLVARQHRIGHRAFEHALPEPAALRGARQHIARRSTEASRKARERSQPRGQQGLDPGAHPSGQHRRSATRGDGDDHRVTVDDRRHDEGREIWPVDDVDRHVGGAAGRRHLRSPGFRTRPEYSDAARHIRRRERSQFELDSAGARESLDFGCDRLGHDTHRRTRAQKQVDAPSRNGISTHHQNGAAPQVEEERQVFHGSAVQVLRQSPAPFPGSSGRGRDGAVSRRRTRRSATCSHRPRRPWRPRDGWRTAHPAAHGPASC